MADGFSFEEAHGADPNAKGAFSFEEAHGGDQKPEPTPIAAQFGGTPGMPEGVSPEASAPVDMQGPSRFGLMADQAFHGGSVGALTDRVNSGQVDQQAADQAFRAIVEARQAGSPVALRNFSPTPEEATQFANNPSALANPHVGVPLPELQDKFNALTQSAAAKREAYDAERAKTKAAFDALPGTFEPPTLGGKAANVLTDAAGMLVGGAANPENLIGGGGGRVVKQAGESAVKFALKAGAEDLGRGAVGGAVGGAVANPAVQAGEISRGERETYDPKETLANAVLGAGVGAAFHVPGILARPLLEHLAAKRGVPVDKIDPDQVSREQFQEALKTDPQFAALAKGAGIEHANDLLALPAPGRAVKTDAEIGLERASAERGRASAAETPPILYGKEGEAPRTSDALSPKGDGTLKALEAPPIRVDSEGNALRSDAGAQEGKAPAEAPPRAEIKPIEEAPKEIDYASQKTSTKAAEPVEGKLATDPNGYVASDKGGPVRFAQEKQAQRFADSQKTGQEFTVEEHPGGKGYTVREAEPARVEAQAAPRAEAPRQIEDGRPYDEKVAAERDRLWAEEMPGYAKDGKPIKQEGGGELASQAVANHGMVDASARETVMRSEAAEPINAARVTPDEVSDISQHYRRGVDETPQQAWDRAIDRWSEKLEADAMRHENGMTAEDQHFDTLAPDGTGDQRFANLYSDNHEAIHGPEVDHDQIPFDGHDRGAGEPHGGDSRAAEGQRGSGGDEARGQAEHGSKVAEGNTDAGPDGGRQTVIPGAERLTDRALAERQGNKPLRGGDEPPPKGGLFDEDARNQKDMFDPTRTMHANPLFDPAVWKWFGKKGLGFDEKWRRDMTGFATDWAKMKEADSLKGGKGNNFYERHFSKNFSTYLFNSVDAEMRALGKLHGDSPTIKALSDRLQPIADVGRGGAVGQSFHEGVTERIVNGTNRLAKALEPFLDKPEVVKQIVKLVENRRSIKPGTPIHDAAASIAKLLDDTHKYLNEAGVKVGKEPDYFPRELNSLSVLAHPEASRADMVRAYRKNGMSAREAEEAAQHWFDRTALGSVNVRAEGTDFLIHGGTPASNFTKERAFSKEAHAIMEKWYYKDPADAIPVYLQRAARRAEWARMMGGEVKDETGKMVWDDNGKWKQMKADLIKEGNAGAIPEVVRLISAATGVNPPAMPSVGRSMLGLLRTASVFKLLPHATLTNLTDMLMPGIRAGSPGRAVGDVFRTVKTLMHAADTEGARAFAEDLGLISHGSTSGILAARYNMDNPGNLLQERLQNRFWRGIGMEQLNQATRTVGVKSGEVFIRRLALDVAGGKKGVLSSRLLTELGVKDVKGFSEWVKSTENPRGDINSTGHADTYRNAVVRFVNQASLLPTKSTKPSWAGHPVGGLIYMLQSYNQAFMRDVYGRAKVQIGDAVSPKSGLSGMDRARILGPVAMLPALMAAQLAVGIPRQAVLGSSGKQTATRDDEVVQLLEQAFSRSLSASLDPIFQIYSSAKYHKSVGDYLHGSALAGPIQMGDALVALAPKTAYGGSNSDKTNSAERNATRSAYENIVTPLILSGVSMLPPQIGLPVSQTVTAGPVKDAIVDAIAGPKTVHGGSRPQRPTRPTRPSR